MKPAQDRRYLWFVAFAAAISILLCDVLTELGVATAVAYMVVVCLAYASGSPRAVVVSAIVCSLFTALGYVFSPLGGEIAKVLANRCLALIAIWTTAVLCLRVLQLFAEHTMRVATAEQSVADVAKELEEDARKRRAITNIMQDLQEERAALKREIQARQAVQEMLQKSEQRFFAIIESAPTAMVMISPEGHIVLVNVEAETLFGYARSALLGHPIELLVPTRFQEQHPAHREEYFAEPKARRMGVGRDLFGLRADGSEFPVEIGLNPIETEDGLFVLSAVVDISERKRAEQEITRINQELRQKNDEMQQFVYTVSHDLKSPLVTCKGFVGLMKEDIEQGHWEDLLDSVDRVERATQRMGDLIEDLLQLSRIGVIRNQPETIDVNEVVRFIADDLTERIAEAGATLTIEEDLPPVVADRVRLIEVFENLLSNAIKYGCRGDDPQITIGSDQCNGQVRYFVRDNGPGIEQKYHERVFGLFQRLEADKEGTGVGLAAVSRIMEVHGGVAELESEAGKGATFWVSFPA